MDSGSAGGGIGASTGDDDELTFLVAALSSLFPFDPFSIERLSAFNSSIFITCICCCCCC